MELHRLVEVVSQVRATRKKTEKTALLAALLGQARGREIELAAMYLAGSLPQGRIGVGWRMIEKAHLLQLPPTRARDLRSERLQRSAGSSSRRGPRSASSSFSFLSASFAKAPSKVCSSTQSPKPLSFPPPTCGGR
jgi:hypothetical protein